MQASEGYVRLASFCRASLRQVSNAYAILNPAYNWLLFPSLISILACLLCLYTIIAISSKQPSILNTAQHERPPPIATPDTKAYHSSILPQHRVGNRESVSL